MAAPSTAMTSLPQIQCFGTPYEIGFAHGTQARSRIAGSITFYTHLFATNCHKTWPEVQEIAEEWIPRIEAKWPALMDEMHGVADGAGVSVSEIVALNVRTEINFGLFSDGCTALSWKHGEKSFLAQNWDWEVPQRENLVLLDIKGDSGPRIKMVTEAGIIGKIGMNEHGVGVCLNAIREKGMDLNKVPCHLGLRLVLESKSREEAVRTLTEVGVASACHMLIADSTGGVGMEWSSTGGAKLEMDDTGRVCHSNHFISPDMKGTDLLWLKDSTFRLHRIKELCEKVDEPDMTNVQALFRDEQNYPSAICRKHEEKTPVETLFNIVMDLSTKQAKITIGRPVNPQEQIAIDFSR